MSWNWILSNRDTHQPRHINLSYLFWIEFIFIIDFCENESALPVSSTHCFFKWSFHRVSFFVMIKVLTLSIRENRSGMSEHANTICLASSLESPISFYGFKPVPNLQDCRRKWIPWIIRCPDDVDTWLRCYWREKFRSAESLIAVAINYPAPNLLEAQVSVK